MANPAKLLSSWPLRPAAPSVKPRQMPASTVKKYVSNTDVRVYRIPCQVLETLSARVYLVLGAGPPTLIDAGSGLALSTGQILAGIQAVHDDFGEDVRPSEIARIVITHGHMDHIGGLPELLRTMPADVAIHTLDRTAVTSGREYAALGVMRLGQYLRRAGVSPERCTRLLKLSPYQWVPGEDVTVSITLADGDELDGLRIIHTPGHSPGHVCIAVGDILLTGDHILSQTLPQQWPKSILPYTGLGHYLESLDKVQCISGIRLALAAHEQPIHDVYRRIDTMRSAHRRRLERLLDLLRKAGNPMSVHEITEASYPETTGYRALLAVTDVGSRVEHLHQCGQLAVDNLDEIERNDTAVLRYRVV
jgi:glyoxylase-like metal-dependent hydrolase (beta-lactamase superfamily II)